MKATSLALAFTVFSILLQSVKADLGLTVIFNNGTIPASGAVCTAQDIKVITEEIEKEQTRQLRGIVTALNGMNRANDEDETGGSNDIVHRDLQQTYSAKCKSYCAGYQTGTCVHPECKGFRRRGLLQSKQRSVQDTCARATTDVDDALKDLLDTTKITRGCKAYIKLPRKITCFDESLYAAVESFVLFSNNGLQTTMKNGMEVCIGSTTVMNIEAVANACLEELILELSGPISNEVRYRKEEGDLAPYMIFGSARVLPIGNYVLKTQMDGSLIPPASIRFSVKQC